MFRHGLFLLAFATACILSDAVQAQQQASKEDSFWSRCKRDYIRNKIWPEPFLRADRESVVAPFSLMVSNGWRRQNLLSDYHFSEESPQLNQAGEAKLRFILTQVPPPRRTVYVQRGLTPEVTATRLAVVQRGAARILPPGYLADIVESDLPNDGWPADDIDAVSRKWQATRPDPRIKAASDSGGGSGGGNQ